jgi:hypothetical protein
MCARRFLFIIFFLTLLAVGSAFAIYQWGGRVLLSQAVPKGHFEAAKAGGAPDYANDNAWLARPSYDRSLPVGAVRSFALWMPGGIVPGGPRGAAAFYIHPTTYLDTDRWNAPFQDTGEAAFRTKLFLQSQASAFNGSAEIWAPKYRQAAYGAFLLKSEDAQKALDLAYGDVAAAFDQFVRERGDKPIILAAHSQGALHLERLLKEKIAGKPIAKRVVAAYVVGWPISTTADLPALGLPACAAPDQTGCILSWMSFSEPANPGILFRDWEKSKGLNGGARRQADVLCVNPVSGVEGGAAPPGDNPGTLVPTADLQSATLQPGLVGGHCSNGLLIVDGTIPPLGSFVLPGNNYHVYDYALFWGAIRRDAERRLAAWHR